MAICRVCAQVIDTLWYTIAFNGLIHFHSWKSLIPHSWKQIATFKSKHLLNHHNTKQCRWLEIPKSVNNGGFIKEVATSIDSWLKPNDGFYSFLLWKFSACLTFLCIKFSTRSPTLMTSFKFDICQCLSFPTYEIWSALSAILSMQIIILPGSSDFDRKIIYFCFNQFGSWQQPKGLWFLSCDM